MIEKNESDNLAQESAQSLYLGCRPKNQGTRDGIG